MASVASSVEEKPAALRAYRKSGVFGLKKRLKVQGLKVQLPTGIKTSQPENKPDFLTLSITKTGDLGIDKEAIRVEELIPRLQKRIGRDRGEFRLSVHRPGTNHDQ